MFIFVTHLISYLHNAGEYSLHLISAAAPMKTPSLAIESNQSYHAFENEAKLVYVFERGELRLRCRVEGAPEMIILWSLLFHKQR